MPFPSAIISGDVVNIPRSRSGMHVQAVTTTAAIIILSASAAPVSFRISSVFLLSPVLRTDCYQCISNRQCQLVHNKEYLVHRCRTGQCILAVTSKHNIIQAYSH